MGMNCFSEIFSVLDYHINRFVDHELAPFGEGGDPLK